VRNAIIDANHHKLSVDIGMSLICVSKTVSGMLADERVL